MGFGDRLKRGLNELFYFGGEVTEEFWEELEDTLVMSDLGARVAAEVTDDLREQAAQEFLRTEEDMKEALAKRIADVFPTPGKDPFEATPTCVLFVGINGSGKTTTAGKIAAREKAAGKKVLLGAADTFRAAAIEQLERWGERAGVDVVSRDRGADPGSVVYEVLERAEQESADLVLIDTAGRLHTSQELMRELSKVVNVARKRAEAAGMPVYVILVVDATTGQNGLAQAKEFNEALELDGLILTKLDGTAKGGIAVTVSSELVLPIYRIGIGEGKDDLKTFDALSFSRALVGEEVEL